MATRKSCCMKLRPWRRFTVSNWWSLRWKKSLFKPWEARSMRNLMLVAKREYLEQIRGRAFRITTILIPALFGMIMAVMAFAGRGANSSKHIILASNDAALATQVRDQLTAHTIR